MEKYKQILKDFRVFIARGSVLDLAVGIVIGSAFTAIVTSLVGDIFTPLLAKLFGGISFSELKIVLTPASGSVAETAIHYGVFLEKVIYFLLVATVVFIVIRQIGKLKRKKKMSLQSRIPRLYCWRKSAIYLKNISNWQERFYFFFREKVAKSAGSEATIGGEWRRI